MENTRAKTTRNSLILLLTATIWGMAFVSQSKGMDYMHPFTFNGVRSLIGACGYSGVYFDQSEDRGRQGGKIRLETECQGRASVWYLPDHCQYPAAIRYQIYQCRQGGIYHDPVYYFCAHVWYFLKKKVAPVVWQQPAWQRWECICSA